MADAGLLFELVSCCEKHTDLGKRSQGNKTQSSQATIRARAPPTGQRKEGDFAVLFRKFRPEPNDRPEYAFPPDKARWTPTNFAVLLRNGSKSAVERCIRMVCADVKPSQSGGTVPLHVHTESCAPYSDGRTRANYGTSILQ